MNRLNRRVTVSPDRAYPGTYLVLIGKTKVGWVRKKEKDPRLSGTSFTFMPELGAYPSKKDAPPILVATTMQGIRQSLDERISHDTYHKILGNEPGKED